jgi:putative N-acetylmannosamine-6-phosphate epimerase
MPDLGKIYTYTVTVSPFTTAQGGFASPEDVKAAMQAGLTAANIPATVGGPANVTK